MPRIAIFLPNLEMGGVSKVFINLASSFVAQGATVDIVLSQAVGELLPELPSGVNTVNFGVRASARQLVAMASLLPLRRYLVSNRPHMLLVAKDWHNMIAVIASKLSSSNTKVILGVHGTTSLETATGWRGKMFAPFFMRLLYPKAHRVVTVSQGVAEDLIGLTGIPRRKVGVIYNPIVTPQMLEKAEEPLSLAIQSRVPVILALGRLAEEKDFETLIKAFARVKAKLTSRLLIVGEGEERGNLEGWIKKLGLGDSVEMPGYLPNPYPLLKRASVLVLSSRREALPTVLIEAMALGCPVVATNCKSGPSEILQGGRWGKLVPVGDVEQMAAAIFETLTQPMSPTNLEEGRVFAMERFGAEQATRQYLALVPEDT